MRVTAFETHLARVPYEESRPPAPQLILRLLTDEGLEGIAYLTPLVRWSVAPVRATTAALAEQVVGRDPLAVERLNAELLAPLTRPQLDGLRRSAVSLVDVALWDLKAKALGLPLWRLLGAESPRVPTYASWNLWHTYDLDTLARHASAAVEQGFRALKFRLGGVRADAECLARARVLREAVGPDVQLLVDLNWAWSADRTIRVGRLLEEVGLGWIEDPVPAEAYAALAKIRRALQTPICAGETYHAAAQFHAALGRGALDVAMIDLECGGVTEWLKLAHLVQSYGVPVTSHMCTEVSAHLVAATGGLLVEYIPWMVPLFREVPPVVDGCLQLSERPGLGLELDAQALARFAAES